MPTIVDFICPHCGCRFSVEIHPEKDDHTHCPYCAAIVALDADPMDLAEQFINRNFHPDSEIRSFWEQLCVAYQNSRDLLLMYIVFVSWFAAFWAIYPTGKEFLLYVLVILTYGWIGGVFLLSIIFRVVFSTRADWIAIKADLLETFSAFVRAIDRVKAKISRE
jgi:hypothetical protein